MTFDYDKLSKEELIKELKRLLTENENLLSIINSKTAGSAGYYDEVSLKPLFDAMDAIETAVYVADMETYEILAGNKYLKRFWGEDIVGKKCYLTLQRGQKGPCPFCTNDKLLNDKGEPNPPYVWLFKNTITGSYYQCVDFAIPWKNGKYVRFEIALNIDKLVSAQKERDTQAEFIKTLIDNIPQAVFWKDKDGVFLGCNKQFALDANCKSPEEIIGKTDYDLPWTREESDMFRKIDKMVMESGRAWLNFEESHTRAGGDKRYLVVSKVPLRDNEGNIIGVLGTYSDITPIKTAMEIVKKNEQLLNSILETYPVGVVQVKDRIIEWCNEEFCKIVGYSREELIGLPTRIFYSSEDEYERIGKVIYGGFSSGKEKVLIETQWKSKSGELVDVRIIAKLKDRNDIGAGIVASVIDIREEKKWEEEKKRTEERLNQLQRIQSLETLAGGVAHDFNNILMAMIGSAELALQELSESSPIRAYLQDLITAGKRGAELANQMLIYAGKRKFVSGKISLNSLIMDMEKLLRAVISKKIVLKIELAQNIPIILGDPTQISQIVMNLVINASEAIGERSGIIIIRTGAVVCSKDYVETMFLPGEIEEGLYVTLEISDNGCGMDSNTMKRIFEPFFTTKFTGRGLGLASVLGIVRSHRGGIKVYSEVGKGTTFKVFLPAVEWTDEKETTFVETLEGKKWKGSGKVLLAEDEEVISALTQRMLEHLGFEVLVARNGREALDLFNKHRDELKFALIDLTMPHKSGIEVCKEIKSIQPDFPIILTSGYPEDEYTEQISSLKISGYLQKPFRFDSLRELVKELVSM